MCDPLGLSSEAPVIVVRENSAKKFLGGAGIVAAHVASLGGVCEFVSVRGKDNVGLEAEQMLGSCQVKHHLFVDRLRPTTFKTRYIADNQKLLRVSKLVEANVGKFLERKIIEKLDQLLPRATSIILSDFVYGMLTPQILKHITDYANKNKVKIFGDLQCSSQVGDVTKFTGFSGIFPTEKEARLATGNKDDGLEFVAQSIIKKTRCERLFLKLGPEGLIVYDENDDEGPKREHFPALTANPLDVSGAGDSLLASIALAISAGATTMEAAAIGNIVASCSVQSMGNIPITKERILETITQF